MLNKFLKPISASAVLLIASITASQAGVVFEDNFEADAVAVPSSSLVNWTIDNGTNVDVVGPSSFGFLCNSGAGGNCLDMDGAQSNGSITTKVALNLLAGVYTFSFDYGNNGSTFNTLSWSVGSFESGIVNTSPKQANIYSTYTNTFTVAADTNGVFINFMGGGNVDSQGTILDNVLLTMVSEVSAPNTVALAGLMLIALAYRARKA